MSHCSEFEFSQTFGEAVCVAVLCVYMTRLRDNLVVSEHLARFIVAVKGERSVELCRVYEIRVLKRYLQPILADQKPPHTLLNLSINELSSSCLLRLPVVEATGRVRTKTMDVEALGDPDCG